MIRITPLEKAHIDLLADPANFPGLLDLIPDPEKYWAGILGNGTSFAGFIDGEFLGCAGWASPWPGVADVWVWETEVARKHPTAFHKLMLRALKHIEKDRSVWRISCEVRRGNERAIRWVTLLGFRFEGLMCKRGPDKSDFLLFAKVKD